MSKKNIIVFLLAIVVLIGSASLLIVNLNNTGSKMSGGSSKNGVQSSGQDFLIDQYPIETVPLYKMAKVESSKFFYNRDPADTSAFDESPFSYFNVVYETTASRDDVFKYYRTIFDKEIKEEFSNPESIKGAVGKYNIEVAQYDEDTVYLQVYVDKNESDNLQKELFSYFPLVDIDLSYVKLNEKSFGLLNQKGGESEYTHYYTVSDTGDVNGDKIDDIDEFVAIQSAIQEKYKNNSDFKFADNVFEWTSDKNEQYTVSLSPDHGRVYIQIRKLL